MAEHIDKTATCIKCHRGIEHVTYWRHVVSAPGMTHAARPDLDTVKEVSR